MSVDLAHHEILRAKVGMGGIMLESQYILYRDMGSVYAISSRINSVLSYNFGGIAPKCQYSPAPHAQCHQETRDKQHAL